MEDLDALLTLEREEIIARYDQGPQAGTPVDPGDDADLLIYRAVDQLGFLHGKELPDLSTQEIKHNLQTAKRADKWVKMLKQWNKYCNSSKHLKELGKVLSPYIKEIDLDVSLTFRRHIMSRERYSIKQQALFHILVTYSIYNPEVGHCQHLSQIVAVLLMYLEEEDAFWALDELMTNDAHAMHGFFSTGCPKLGRFLVHHDYTIGQTLPRLKHHMDQEQLFSQTYCAQWFLECFLHRVAPHCCCPQTPFPLTLRIWDAFILDGERVLTSMAYTMLKVHEKQLLRLPREGMQDFLHNTLAQPWGLPDDQVLRHLQVSMSYLRRLDLDLPPPAVPEAWPVIPLQQTSVVPSAARLCPGRQLYRSEPSFPVTPEVMNRSPETVAFFADLNASYPSALAWLIGLPQACHNMGFLKPHPSWSSGQQASRPRTPLLPRGTCSPCPTQGGEPP
ncbi:USP6 N-terminal-like protein isoform X3 [Talpa occidentalis]|uniref:USP6 N-terminal-like protein isoform X3 n=1 Tax=Talpa occidentalis TaxID=50954 RepID=UPI001890A7F0|nr:USP6 N-terminal-like protein isoform X3 [Talpa occidentalis]